MIAKGASRSGPRQLAVYLMRVERYETGEPVELLELNSPWASTLAEGSSRPRIASRLIETFRDWQSLTEGTRQGRDGLYHAEISPEAHYAATMTPEQWKRAADILGEELGFQEQERALVLHGGTDGRKHMHVVWARTDLDAMKMISDSRNYEAHERASQRMELEFGQDFVPGKHAKRDREQQPEFPRQEAEPGRGPAAEANRAEGQEPESRDRGPRMPPPTARRRSKPPWKTRAISSPRARRGYIVVDEAGGHSVLSRNIGLKKKEVDAFMAGIELDKLPTIEEAKALQKEARQREKSQAPAAAQPEAKPVEKAPEAPLPVDLTLYAPKPASKFLSSELAQKIEPPAPTPAQAPQTVQPFDYELYANYNRKPEPTPVVQPGSLCCAAADSGTFGPTVEIPAHKRNGPADARRRETGRG